MEFEGLGDNSNDGENQNSESAVSNSVPERSEYCNDDDILDGFE